MDYTPSQEALDQAVNDYRPAPEKLFYVSEISSHNVVFRDLGHSLAPYLPNEGELDTTEEVLNNCYNAAPDTPSVRIYADMNMDGCRIRPAHRFRVSAQEGADLRDHRSLNFEEWDLRLPTYSRICGHVIALRIRRTPPMKILHIPIHGARYFWVVFGEENTYALYEVKNWAREGWAPRKYVLLAIYAQRWEGCQDGLLRFDESAIDQVVVRATLFAALQTFLT